MQRRDFLLKTAASVGVASLALAGCTVTKSTSSRSHANPVVRKHDIDTNVDSALKRLGTIGPDAMNLVRKAHGILVFPAVIGGAIWVGGQYGEGALRVKGHMNGGSEAYYNIVSASFGAQIGAQSKAIFFLFMTPDSLNKFRNGPGWSGGIDGSVAALTVGANGSIDSRTVQKPVIAFALTNAGLMASLALEGTKITKLKM